MGRRSKRLSREEQQEVEAWIYQNNTEEKRISDTMTVNVKCKTENQKAEKAEKTEKKCEKR